MGNKKLLISGGIGILILAIAVGGFFATRGSSNKAVVAGPTPTPAIVDLLPSDALSVSLKAQRNNQYVLTVDTIPERVTAISYEITYDTENKGTQGIVGSPVSLKDGQTTYTNNQIIFGTCSRNKCVYDQGVSNITINIRLTYKDGSEKGWKGTLEI